MNLYIVSEKQGSGKTFITAGIAATMQSLGYSVGYYKPVQTGAYKQNNFLNSQDVIFVKKIDPNVSTSVSYVFETEALPLIASQKENNPIKPEVLVKDFLRLRKSSEIVLVEGCNGLLTPFSENIQTIEFIQAIQTSVLIIAEPSHNVLENILLMINYLKHYGITVCGVILNKYMNNAFDLNIKNLPSMIEMYSKVPVVGVVEFQGMITPSGLIDMVLHSIDIETIFNMKIPKLNNF